jgi:glycosyltransferase involved in cell wall biosynthesis
MRIAIVGPTHPYKGGIAQYTTALAHQLAADGHDVRIESWAHQYPALLYPGQQTVTEPELTPYPDVTRRLSWARPHSWVACGRRLRDADLVVLVVVTPVQVPAYRGILSGLGRDRPTVVAQCHNVIPHERRFADVALLRGVLSRVDAVLVHSDDQARLAATLTDLPIAVEHMAPLVVAPPSVDGSAGQTVHRRLLFFGIVRPYKGLDLLVRALAAGPDDVRLRVSGEFWGGPESTERLAEELGVADRLELRPGYVDAADVPELFHDVDALVLPYRSATASLNAFLAFNHGRPVIATRVGTIPDDVRDGVDGVLCEPADLDSLTGALGRFYSDGEPLRLRGNVRRVEADSGWRRYCGALISVTGLARRRLAPRSDPAQSAAQLAGVEIADLPAPARRGLAWWLKAAFLVATVAGALWYLASTWQETGQALERIGWASALLSAPLAVGGTTAAMFAWRRLLADLGYRLPVGPAGRVYFTSQLGKYLPGSVWTFLAQVELARRQKVPRSVSLAVSMLAIVLSLTVGLGMAFALLPLGAGEALRRYWWLALLAPVLLVAVHPKVIAAVMKLAARVLGRPQIQIHPTGRGMLAAAGWQVLSWSLLGLHCFVLARGVGVTGWSGLPLAVGGFALAYCAGLLFLPAPAGVGVRELALAAALATAVPAPAAAAVVLMSRVVLVAVDLGSVLAWSRRYARLGRRQRATRAEPASADDPAPVPVKIV